MRDWERCLTLLPDYAATAADTIEEIRSGALQDRLVNLSSVLYEHHKSTLGKESGSERKTGLYHPSDLSVCMLSATYRKIGTPFVKRTSLEGELTLGMGHAVHDMIQRLLKEAFGEENVLIEVPVLDTHLKISGHADAVITIRDRGEPYRVLVEIKSKKTTEKLRSPIHVHLLQAHYYMYVLKIPVGTILYVDKSQARPVDYPFLFDVSIFEEAVNRIVTCEYYLSIGEMPPAEPSPFCSECGVNHLCTAWQSDRNRRVPLRVLGAIGGTREQED